MNRNHPKWRWTGEHGQHEWRCSGWEPCGGRPRADEWECIHCGLIVDDGEEAPTLYCEDEEE